jgi:filamentous hemagglutinin
LASLGPLVITRANQIDNRRQAGQPGTEPVDRRPRQPQWRYCCSQQTADPHCQWYGAKQCERSDFQPRRWPDLNAASLDNAKGSLQSQGDLTVKTSGAIDNQSGRIVAKDGNLDITAASLDSRGGVLSSLQGAFSSHITGVLRNGYDLNNNRQGGSFRPRAWTSGTGRHRQLRRADHRANR